MINCQKPNSRVGLSFSTVLVAVAALILLLFLVIGFSFAAGKGQTGSDLPDSSREPEATSQEQEQSEIVELERELSRIEAELATALAQLELLQEAEDYPAELIAGYRQRLQDEATAAMLYERVIAALASQGITCEVNEQSNSLRFPGYLLFDSSSSVLTAADESFLTELFPILMQAVEQAPEYDRLEQIIFAGHADDGGSHDLNIVLSHDRATAVFVYLEAQNLLDISIDAADHQGPVYAISGFSNQLPVLVEGSIDRDLSRRVELAFIMDNSQLDQVVFGHD